MSRPPVFHIRYGHRFGRFINGRTGLTYATRRQAMRLLQARHPRHYHRRPCVEIDWAADSAFRFFPIERDPHRISQCASRFACAFNSRKVTDCPRSTMAIASGVFSTCASNNSVTEAYAVARADVLKSSRSESESTTGDAAVPLLFNAMTDLQILGSERPTGD